MVKESLLKLTNTNEYKIVSTSIASIYNKPSFSSELVTQALIWEALIVISKKDNWYKVQLKDKYIGWIHNFYITDSSIYDKNSYLKNHENWYWVKDKFISLLLNNMTTFIISYGSCIPCFIENDTYFTLLPNKQKAKINKDSLVSLSSINNYKENIIYSMMQLLGTPYLWGGKSFFGFDCSGLIQSILNICNFKLPRDASDQILSKKIIENSNNPNIGDLIFFKSKSLVNHVGLYINKTDFIHSSGYVKVNSINSNSKYFCPNLNKNYFKTFKTLHV